MEARNECGGQQSLTTTRVGLGTEQWIATLERALTTARQRNIEARDLIRVLQRSCCTDALKRRIKAWLEGDPAPPSEPQRPDQIGGAPMRIRWEPDRRWDSARDAIGATDADVLARVRQLVDEATARKSVGAVIEVFEDIRDLVAEKRV